MKPTQAQQQALLTLLSRIYSEIRAIEELHHIRARVDDFRPRIDYFHDAVRAFTEKNASGFENTGRLSVESLAADISMLRQISEKPLLRHPDLAIPLSPQTQVAHSPAMPVPDASHRIDVGVASTLSEGYSHYALLFVALLSYAAERNYMNRVNEANSQLDKVMDLVQDTKAQSPEAEVKEDHFLAGITDPELRKKLLAGIKAAKKHKHATAHEVLEALHQQKAASRKEIAALDAAHLHYASSQLILYQEAHKLVKKMAEQGLNIVGEFVETAVREAQRGSGRGF